MTLDTIVTLFHRAKEDEIEAFVEALPKERVVPTLYEISEYRRALYETEKMLRSRVAGEEILSIGEAWTANDGREFTWVGDRERVCSDPTALRSQLLELPLSHVARTALKEAFKEQPLKVYFTHLDRVAQFGGAEAEKVIRSFVVWKEGAPKLRAIGEDGR